MMHAWRTASNFFFTTNFAIKALHCVHCMRNDRVETRLYSLYEVFPQVVYYCLFPVSVMIIITCHIIQIDVQFIKCISCVIASSVHSMVNKATDQLRDCIFCPLHGKQSYRPITVRLLCLVVTSAKIEHVPFGAGR